MSEIVNGERMTIKKAKNLGLILINAECEERTQKDFALL